MFVNSFEGDVSMGMTVKHGQPRTGRKNARKMTRAECELTDLPRWVQIYTSPATGETSFKNADIVGGAKTVYSIRKKLSKFWG
jgi:hypothetical protein